MNLHPTPEETIYGTSQAIRAGQKSASDVVRDCLAKIDALEPTLQAWVSVDRDGALQRAEELDRAHAAGRFCGPLHGIPIGIKDIFDVAGLPTAAGSELFAKNRAPHDCTAVSRLRAAGAIILGKTVTTQYASFDPPVTRNPWHPDRTPGGSSSGSAAAVATGMCLGALGSQTGGSITRPASFCGIAGCKPTFGRISVQGVFPFAPSLDHPGPMARSVRDLAVLLDAISGSDVHDPECLALPPTQLAAELENLPATAPRLGRLRGMFDELASPAVQSRFDVALVQLEKSGATLAESRLPASFDGVIRNHRTLMTVEFAARHEERVARHPEDYLPCVRGVLDEGIAASGPDYARCRQHQSQLRREIISAFDGVDVLVCPSTVTPAPSPETTGNPSFNAPWSYTGLPTISIPMGLDQEGLPLGLQLVGRHLDEATLFAAAAWCEAKLALRR